MTTGRKKIVRNNPLSLKSRFRNKAMIIEKINTIGTETRVSMR